MAAEWINVDKWCAAVEHSREHPDHTLAPHQRPGSGEVDIECLGCDFDTASASVEVTSGE